jgi:hypothetical protein
MQKPLSITCERATSSFRRPLTKVLNSLSSVSLSRILDKSNQEMEQKKAWGIWTFKWRACLSTKMMEAYKRDIINNLFWRTLSHRLPFKSKRINRSNSSSSNSNLWALLTLMIKWFPLWIRINAVREIISNTVKKIQVRIKVKRRSLSLETNSKWLSLWFRLLVNLSPGKFSLKHGSSERKAWLRSKTWFKVAAFTMKLKPLLTLSALSGLLLETRWHRLHKDQWISLSLSAAWWLLTFPIKLLKENYSLTQSLSCQR